ncbi:aspartate/tyrosine/aromatic aminotransferase [Alteromonas ponticola]|uniref:Aminotransferase n=1 Tax=Alteromonas aquimaris TaxID=2998417 RepID=A0ABT3P5W8_9ALTE|nr:aspartate/tyrosine/aromatic aminotransferase [Alteromonas aquimaris]MCW8108164.1 aspartate/tyrosine/aromatic aminotransferase [Alteromonas aquimaris]
MFEVLTPLAPDPILGLSVAYNEDSHPHKIDLGVGVYKDEQGNTPILKAVVKAQHKLLAAEKSKTYISPQGHQGYIDGMLTLLLSEKSQALRSNRVAAVQAPGGCGALRILAELIARANKNAKVWVSDPTWANHIPLIGSAGLEIQTYPYFDKATASINFDAMMDTLRQCTKGDVVLLHGCCHNPTGADLTNAQWDEVLQVAKEREFVPFLDVAYLGFGDGLNEDAYGIRLLTDNLPEVLIAASCSKNFGLYRERVGLAAIITKDTANKQIVQGQIQSVARGIYSMPPSYGGALVDMILNDEQLKHEWITEVDEMRNRMKSLRAMLVDQLAANGADRDFSFVNSQKGMFSFLCITPEQVREIRSQHSVYFVESSRVNIAGINKQNVKTLAKALVSVIK